MDINLGHANPSKSIKSDGYYDLTRTDQTYTSNMRMLTGIAPYPLDASTPEFWVYTPGTLQEVLGGEIQSRRHCRIKLYGHLNKEDFKCLRELSAITTGQLSYIDLSEVTIEDDEIPEDAFVDSYTLQEIKLPLTAKSIAPRAFRNANGLWKVSLPEGLEQIKMYAFSACRYLESLTLPSSLNDIGYNPLRYLHLLIFDVDKGNDYFVISNGALCDKNKTRIYSMPLAWNNEYTVEEGIQVIDTHALSMQCMIPAVYLPSSVYRLKQWAFFECISLKDFYVASDTPPRLDGECFSQETYATCTLHIPPGSRDSYLESDWSEFANIIEDENLATPAITDHLDKQPTGIFDLHGQKITNPIQGEIYIFRYSNGTTSKIKY